MKICKKCGENKPLDDFYVNKQMRSGRVNQCKACVSKRYRETTTRQREHWLRRNYQLTTDEYDEMLASQNGVCAICHEKCTNGRRLAVDHDHRTGKVRGLLCSKCNTALGGFRESEDLLQKAIRYLQNFVESV